MIDWVIAHRPQSFDEMALYPELRERLEFYAKTGSFSHLLMIGDTGVGKTTAARILGDLTDFTTLEEDCAADSSKARMLSLIKGTTSVSLFGTRRIIIMDEFHEVPMPVQKVFNKSMEDGADRNIYILCVNDEDGVAAPIKSRCMELRFDVAVLPKRTMKLQMMPWVNFGVEEWKLELKRIGKIVAKKAGYEVSEEQLSAVASRDVNILDARKFIRNLEERIKMDEAKN